MEKDYRLVPKARRLVRVYVNALLIGSLLVFLLSFRLGYLLHHFHQRRGLGFAAEKRVVQDRVRVVPPMWRERERDLRRLEAQLSRTGLAQIDERFVASLTDAVVATVGADGPAGQRVLQLLTVHEMTEPGVSEPCFLTTVRRAGSLGLRCGPDRLVPGGTSAPDAQPPDATSTGPGCSLRCVGTSEE